MAPPSSTQPSQGQVSQASWCYHTGKRRKALHTARKGTTSQAHMLGDATRDHRPPRQNVPEVHGRRFSSYCSVPASTTSRVAVTITLASHAPSPSTRFAVAVVRYLCGRDPVMYSAAHELPPSHSLECADADAGWCDAMRHRGGGGAAGTCGAGARASPAATALWRMCRHPRAAGCLLLGRVAEVGSWGCRVREHGVLNELVAHEASTSMQRAMACALVRRYAPIRVRSRLSACGDANIESVPR